MTDTTHANQNIKSYFLMLKAVSKQGDQQRRFQKKEVWGFHKREIFLYIH